MITPIAPPSMPPAAPWRGYLWWRAIQISLLPAFLYLYAAVLPPLVADWLDDPNYSHGFLVPGLSAYFVWDRRQTLARLKPQPHWVGLIILLFGLAMLFLGHLGAELFLMRSSMVVVITALVWYLLGRPYVYALAFPLAFLLFMIPLPAILLNTITLPLGLRGAVGQLGALAAHDAADKRSQGVKMSGKVPEGRGGIALHECMAYGTI